MHRVVVRNGRKIIRQEEFDCQESAFTFLESWQDRGYAVEYKNLKAYTR